MRTGDVMRIDSNNLYHIVDRKKVGHKDGLPSGEIMLDTFF